MSSNSNTEPNEHDEESVRHSVMDVQAAHEHGATNDNSSPKNNNKKKQTNDDHNGRHALALGGSAGILAGATYVVGFVLYGMALPDLFAEEGDGVDALERVSFLKENQEVFYTANFLVYIVNGFLQVALSCAIYQYYMHMYRGVDNESGGIYNSLTAVFGCIWGALVIAAGMIGNGGGHVAVQLYESDPERAATVWATVDAVYTNGIGGGNEIVGAVWISMVSILSMTLGAFPKPVNILGMIAGAAGFVTIVPGMDEATSIFGIVMIVWYILAGMWLLRAFKQSSSA